MATDYYVDSAAGSDSNNGTSSATPWKTLTKVNAVPQYQPGDHIKFKRGGSWTGTLHVVGTGSSSARLVVEDYGTGAAPIINGAGASETVNLWNKSYFTLQNLEIVNDSATASARYGIRLEYNLAGVFTDVQILNNDIHNIKGLSDRANLYGNAAIYIRMSDGTNFARLDHLLIQGNAIYDTGNISIYHKSANYYGAHPEYWATNLVIRENVFDQTGADHIVILGANAPLVERNAGYDAGINGHGYGWIAGMWSAVCCKDATFQYNEVARTQNEVLTGENAANDGDSQAFDCDLGASGLNLFQYNYTHDNKGGVLIMMAENLPKTVVYRYNLSVNDDRQTNSGSQFPILAMEGVNAAYVYNNVFYTTLERGIRLIDRSSTYFYNNIFHTPWAAYPSKTTFSNNCYYGHTPDVNDPYKVVANPLFVGPLPTTAGGDGYTSANMDMFMLQNGSPCINAGRDMTNDPIPNGGVDLWENPLYAGGLADIGAHEVVGGSASAPAQVTFIDDQSTSVAYTGGGWTHYSDDPLYFGETKTLASTAGRSVTCTFSGTNVSLFGRMGPSYGKLNVSIDNGPAVSVDCYWPSDKWRTELFNVTGLANGSHTIKATTATTTWTGIDYFQVMPGTPPAKAVVTRINNTASAGVVSYSSGWTATSGDSSFYASTRALSSAVGSYVDFTFTGTGARIYGTLYRTYGKLSVSVDGAPAKLVNCFQPGLVYDKCAKLYEVNGLSNGTHTLRATVAAKDPLSNGNSVSIELFESLVGGWIAPTEVIVDNTDTTGITLVGAWTSSTYFPGYYGTNYLHDGNTGKGTKSIRFTPDLPSSGTYEVFAWWEASGDRATIVPIDIVSASGTTPTSVNQRLNGSQWWSLGTYTFNAGTAGSVLIRTTGTTNGYVMADAVRFVRQ